MDMIEKAREFGKAIAQDERVIRYNLARQKSDEDLELQEMIGQFNLKRIELNAQLGKAEKDDEKIASLDKGIKALYEQIMQNDCMKAYNAAKQEVDAAMRFVNQILAAAVNGEDPDTVTEDTSCGGDCASCGGCH